MGRVPFIIFGMFSLTKHAKFIFIGSCLLLLSVYGLGRLYYALTAGFTLGKITSDLTYDSRWEIPPLNSEEKERLTTLLSQEFSYLGRGCQAYVFESADGKYVIKFFKFYHFRPASWVIPFSFLPPVDDYLQKKSSEKKQLLDTVCTSWKIAYEDLQEETGVVYIHLNKSRDLKKTLTLVDKMGFKHTIPLDNYEFMIQRKARLIGPVLEDLMAAGKLQEAKSLIDQLMEMIFSEFQRGYADNDHALMQNTGVIDGKPIHIDVGQFVRNQSVKEHAVYDQELFNKTWRFRQWLEPRYPALADHVVEHLNARIGKERMRTLTPRLNKMSMGILYND